METLKQRILEHFADLLNDDSFEFDMQIADCIDHLPPDKSELHLLMTDAAFKVFCNYFGKQDNTKQCAINGVVLQSEQLKMFENMQYYMEYCQKHGYVSPEYWFNVYKHF